MYGADYTTNNLAERAAQARFANQSYLEQLEGHYKARKVYRLEKQIPVLGICGMGRAGKDTAAEFLCDKFGIVYPKSASWQILPLVAHMIGVSQEEAWRDRHQNREFWIAACHALRKGDVGLLVRMCLGAGDVAVGLRGKEEFHTVMREGLVDLMLWIDRPQVGNDITVEFTRDDCDVVVDNHTSLERFHDRLVRFGRTIRLGGTTTTGIGVENGS